MNFAFSETQQLLADQVSRFIDRDYDFESRRALLASDAGYSPAHWQTFAELGWLGLPFDEDAGGFGGDAVDLLVLFEAFGRGLLLEPYLANVVLAGSALALSGAKGAQAQWLQPMIAGERRLALAYAEPGARFDALRPGTEARAEGDGWRLHGEKVLVLHGADADALVVSATTPQGAGLFLVPADAGGLERRGHATFDGQRAASVRFEGTALAAHALLAQGERAEAVLDQVLARGIAALCAEAVGCMDALRERTLEYLKTRKQFGRAIGEFQVLQHRMVDLFMRVEQARSMACLAAMSADLDDPVRRQQAIAAAKVYIGDAGREVGEIAVQLHGGMGVTDELDVSHYFRRLTGIGIWLGDADLHLQRFIDARQRLDAGG